MINQKFRIHYNGIYTKYNIKSHEKFDFISGFTYNKDIEKNRKVQEVEGKGISQAVIRRLPRYYRYLGELLEDGVERISSNDLSKRMKVTASQIRQDLNNFGGFGQQGYGYNVKYLHSEIGKILGLDREHNMIIIGAGNLGQALANYTAFERSGFMLKGLFDVNPTLAGVTVRGIEIRMMDELKSFIRNTEDKGGCCGKYVGGKRYPGNLEFRPYGSESPGAYCRGKRTSFRESDETLLQCTPL